MGGGSSTDVRRRLPARPASVAEARHLVRAVLLAGNRADLLDSAELLVSEVVTNALVHAGTVIDVHFCLDDGGLIAEVVDGSPHMPITRHYSSLAGTGRGLRLLEKLVDRWGVRRQTGSKTVWFELRTGELQPRGEHAAADIADSAAEPLSDETMEIVLLNMPLLLHTAWQMHADAVLREFLLSRLDDQTAGEEIARHAAANDAMALLQQHIPAPDLGGDPQDVMAAATEPLVSAAQLRLPVPRRSMTHFQVLNDALDAAADLADAGAFLTPPIQPELRMMRRWICAQVSEQGTGTGPTPWDLDAAASMRPPGTPLDWDATAVVESEDALIAADDTNRVLALSRSALSWLGYDDLEELRGQRLLAIIPWRYRQAHLAGFTMHLAAGRASLIGNVVVVPALRKDGSETQVEMLLQAEQLPGGRRLFLAELRQAS
jgi:PAS domain S-box-containing protein